MLSDENYELLYPTGSRPGLFYGLPKIHKSEVPIRPIMYAIGTSGYRIGLFLVSFIQICGRPDKFSAKRHISALQNY